MKKTKKQTGRLSDVERELIKSTFAENDELCIAIRKGLLATDALSKGEEAMLKEVRGNKALMALISKFMAPTFDFGAPLTQMTDHWHAFQPNTLSPDDVAIKYHVHEQGEAFLQEAVANLAAGEANTLAENVEGTVKDKSNWKFVRQYIVAHVENNLNMFITLGGKSHESVEQTNLRLMEEAKKNSAR